MLGEKRESGHICLLSTAKFVIGWPVGSGSARTKGQKENRRRRGDISRQIGPTLLVAALVPDRARSLLLLNHHSTSGGEYK